MMRQTTATSVSLCFDSVNNSCPKFHTYPPPIRVCLYTFFGTVSVLTVLGNFLVVITVVYFKQLHTPTNYLILSLALADLLVGALLMPPFIVHTVESCWYTGQLHCRIHMGLAVLFCNTSILHLSFIAIDRYFAVCHPLSYQITITSSVTALMIFISWSIPATVGFCVSFLTNQFMGSETFSQTFQMCEGACFVVNSQLSAALFSILVFYIPGIIMICIYAKIYHIAKRQARLIEERQKTILASGQKQNVSTKIEGKATKTLAIVMGVFLTCWLPFFICNVIEPFVFYSVPPLLIQTFTWIGCFNSMCNPIVYALFYSWFRDAFKILLSGKLCHKDSSSLNMLSD